MKLFKTEKDAIKWVNENIPFAIKNSKKNLVFPFISYKAQAICAETLGKALFKKQQEKWQKIV